MSFILVFNFASLSHCSQACMCCVMLTCHVTTQMSMFKCEDDRFELDMLIEHTAGAVRSLSSCMDALPEGDVETNGDRHSYMAKFKPQHIKVIGLIYGDHTSEMLENVDRAPRATLNILLQRLRQRHAEWSKARRDMNKVMHAGVPCVVHSTVKSL